MCTMTVLNLEQFGIIEHFRMPQKDIDGMANNGAPDQTAL